MPKKLKSPSCNANPKAVVDLKAAKWATDYLVRRTKEDPWFNGLTLLLHSGQVDYTKHQLVLERILAHGPKASKDKEWFRSHACEPIFDPFTGKVVTPLTQATGFIEKAPVLSKRFIEKCGEKGEKCKGQKNIERLLQTLYSPTSFASISKKNRLPGQESISVSIPEGAPGCPGDGLSAGTKVGFGPKIRELAREYAGNPNAVAVDRHIGAWVCGNFMGEDTPEGRALDKSCRVGFPALKFQDIIDAKPGTPEAMAAEKKLIAMKENKTSLAPGDKEWSSTYRTLKGKIIVEAEKCGVTPAVMQVGAWFKQACRGEDETKGIFGKASKHKFVWLGARKKLDVDDDVSCEGGEALKEACESPKMYSGSIGFCSEEKKKLACTKFMGLREKFADKYTRKPKEAAAVMAGLHGKNSKKKKKKVCDLASRQAFMAMLDDSI
jgi:hypothetical protein